MSNPSSDAGSIRTIKLWFKAFIPRDVAEAADVPGTTQHAGKTMLSSPGPINACFLTDQRSFSDDLNAESRMHSEIDIDVVAGRVLNEVQKCYPTIQIDCETGEELCHESADTSDMKFSDFEVTDGGKTIRMHLHGSTKNACLKVVEVKISPNLDYDGDITITLATPSKALIRFEGNIETYPAFEMYASLNGGKAQPVFRAPIVPGRGVGNLLGPPTRPVKHEVEVTV